MFDITVPCLSRHAWLEVSRQAVQQSAAPSCASALHRLGVSHARSWERSQRSERSEAQLISSQVATTITRGSCQRQQSFRKVKEPSTSISSRQYSEDVDRRKSADNRTRYTVSLPTLKHPLSTPSTSYRPYPLDPGLLLLLPVFTYCFTARMG